MSRSKKERENFIFEDYNVEDSLSESFEHCSAH